MSDFTMPSLGSDMEAGTLVEWNVAPGDWVKRGDIVAVVETQKGAIDIEIFEDGQIEALLVEPGATVPVGTVLARVRNPAAAPGPEVAPAKPSDTAAPRPASAARTEASAAPPSVPAPSAPLPPSRAPSGPDTLRPSAAPPPPAPRDRPRASPAARAAAAELGVAIDDVQGTGPGGAITREDVERAARAAKATAAAPSAPAAPSRPGMRRAIAAAMSRSKREIPHYYLATRIDASRALGWLEQHNAGLAPAERVLPLVLLLKAVALATAKVPEVNGFYEGGEFRAASSAHLGIAISLREGGLMVPALHDVASKPIDVLARELTDLIERTRRGQLRSSELSDATLTVTSLGERGVEEVYGVIFPPQVAIVGFGRIVQSACVEAGQCVPRPTLTATLAADHRVSDGHRGGLFLAEVRGRLETMEIT